MYFLFVFSVKCALVERAVLYGLAFLGVSTSVFFGESQHPLNGSQHLRSLAFLSPLYDKSK